MFYLKKYFKGMQNKSRLRTKLFLVIIVLTICIWVRFAFLEQQGFVEGDEYAIYRTFSQNFLKQMIPAYDAVVGSVGGNIFGRPPVYISSWFLLKNFGDYPSILLYYNAFFGVLVVFMIYIIGERFISKNAGLFASALMSTIFVVVFFSRNMKQMSVAWFFCAAATWFLFQLNKSPKIYNYFLCGVSLGLAVTTHPNTFIFAALILLIVTVTEIIKIFKSSSWRNRIQSAGKALCCPLGMFVPMIAGEIYFWTRKSNFEWDIEKFGYFSVTFSSIFNPAKMRGPAPSSLPGIGFYLKAVTINGHLFLLLIIISGLWLIISPSRLKKYGFYILMLFWGIIVIYGLSQTPFSQARNISSALLPACLICGAGLAGLTNWVESKKYGNFKFLLLPLLVIVVLIFGLSDSYTCIRNTSAAQQIHDYIQVGRASLTRPGKPIYHWEHHYFRDIELSCNTWSDVLRNYLSRRAEYLIQLIPNWTKAEELVDPKFTPTKMFRNLTDTKREIYYGVFDLNMERKIFSEKFGFTRIPWIDMPSEFYLKSCNSPILSNDTDSYPAQLEINPPQGANLLLINGRLPLHNKDDLLIVALGDYSNPNKFSKEEFQIKPSLTPSLTPSLISIHTVWRLIEPVPKNIVLSFIYTGDNAKSEEKQIKLSNFEISFYNLPDEHLTLAEECPKIIDK